MSRRHVDEGEELADSVGSERDEEVWPGGRGVVDGASVRGGG